MNETYTNIVHVCATRKGGGGSGTYLRSARFFWMFAISAATGTHKTHVHTCHYICTDLHAIKYIYFDFKNSIQFNASHRKKYNTIMHLKECCGNGGYPKDPKEYKKM